MRPSAGGVARRRRERRLRSWWRHEQQTVRMALAAATHHSAQQNAAPRGPKTGARAREVEEQATHDGLRAQTAPPPGARPGILAEPGPQRSDRSLRHSSGGAPSLALVSLAGGDTPDDATVAFLLSAALALKKEEEEEERRKREEELRADEKKKLEARERKRAKALKGWDEEALWQLNRRVQAGSTLSSAEYAAWYYWDASSSSSKRKKKKKRKKKLPKAAVRSSSGSSSSFVPAGFTGYAAPRAVFFVVVRPRCSASWPVWNSLTVTQWAGFACHDAPRAVFLPVVLRPRMLCIMAGMDPKDCSALFPIFTWFTRIVRTILVLLSVLLVLPVTIHLSLCSFVVFAPNMLGILVDTDQKDSYGDVGKDCALALLGVVLGFIAGCGYGADGKGCALALLGLVLVFTAACCSSSTRSSHPVMSQRFRRLCMVPRLQAWRRLSSPHVEKTVKIPQLQLVGGAVLG